MQQSSSSVWRLGVIGAGVTGLAAAHRCLELARDSGRRIELRVWEQAERCGGVFGTERRGDVLIERGADSMITNKPAGVELCRRLGLADRFIGVDKRFRRALILHQGRPVPVPSGFQLMAPTQWAPFWRSPLLSGAGKLRAACEPWIPSRSAGGEESLADFVRRRFGHELFENLAQPLIGGIYTADPERLSVQAALPRFAQLEQQYGSVIRGLRRQQTGAAEPSGVGGARYDLFVSLPNGMQELLDALQQRVHLAAQLNLGKRVSAIHPDHATGDWRVELAVGGGASCNGLILATPGPVSGRLLKSFAPDWASPLCDIETASSAIVVTDHAEADFEHPLDASGLVIPRREGRRILAVSFLSRKFRNRSPDGRVLLRTFVGGALQPEEFARTDDEMVNSVLCELRSIFGLRRRPRDASVHRYPEAMPQYTLGHIDRMSRLERASVAWPTVRVAGNALQGVGIPDCIASGESAAEAVWSALEVVSQRPQAIGNPNIGNG